MKKRVLFNGKVIVGISDIGDGTMRYFGSGDEMEVIKRQEELGELVGLSGDKVARVRTVYERRDCYTEYGEVTEANVSEYSVRNMEKQILVSDGLVTRCKDVGILLPLADCLGAVVFDEKQEIVGLLHAGRHNIEQYGPKKFIEYMVNEFGSDAGGLKIFFSPCAQNYRIDELGGEKLSVAAVRQFVDVGVLAENIINEGIDTVTDERYPSCSAGDAVNRFAVVVRMGIEGI